MQTAKNVFLWPGRDWLRKALEAYFTALIELAWGKQRIIEVYLNVVEWGPGIYGAEAAAEHYFHKPAAQLSPVRGGAAGGGAARPARPLRQPARARGRAPAAALCRADTGLAGLAAAALRPAAVKGRSPRLTGARLRLHGAGFANPTETEMARPIVYGPAGSTYVWSARLALAEKGVAHELVDVRFGAASRGAASVAPSVRARCRPSSMTGSRCTRRRRSCAISTRGFRSRRCSRPICTNSRG